MKQDNRILLHFLPHILLHALLEGDNMISDKSFKEIQTITRSFTDQKPLDPKAFNVSFFHKKIFLKLTYCKEVCCVTKWLQLRPIPLTGVQVEPQTITPEELKQTQCTKVVFLVLDFLDRWLREWQWQKGTNNSSNEHYAIIKVNIWIHISFNYLGFTLTFLNRTINKISMKKIEMQIWHMSSPPKMLKDYCMIQTN